MNNKLKDLRSTLNDTIFQENHFTQKSRQEVFERIQKSEESPFRFIKRFIHLIKRPMISVTGMLILCSALFFIIQNEFRNQEPSTGENEPLNHELDRTNEPNEQEDLNFDGLIVPAEDIIPTEPLWHGLSVTLENDLPPFGSVIFFEKEHYEEFARKYFSWTNGEVSADVAEVDFSKEAIIFTAGGKARPFRAVSSQVKAYAVMDGKLQAFHESVGTPGIVDTSKTEEVLEIYAINLDVVQKSDLPKDFPEESIYNPNEDH
jgi:hypothetical protein